MPPRGSARTAFERITDRREAIRKAIEMAGPRDIVLIAGKGHEAYQQIGETKFDFDDRQEADMPCAICATNTEAPPFSMNRLSWSQIAQWSGGQLLQGSPAETVDALSTDTRSLKGGELFVALRGEKFDAHDFLGEAIKVPIAGLLLHDLPLETESFRGAIVRVTDTLAGLQNLARHYRRELDIPIVGITGSSGKTSTKDLVRSVLGQRWKVAATKGNLNNHIGVPLTLLSMNDQTEAGVVEMGMSHAGEIEVLAEIAAPKARFSPTSARPTSSIWAAGRRSPWKKGCWRRRSSPAAGWFSPRTMTLRNRFAGVAGRRSSLGESAWATSRPAIWRSVGMG